MSVVLMLLAALASVVVIGNGAAWWDGRRRQSRYKPVNDLPTLCLPAGASHTFADAIAAATRPGWFEACGKGIEVEDKSAASLQRRYHSSVTQCIWVLGFGFIVTCLSSIAIRNDLNLEHYAAGYDFMATIYALFCFLRARHINRNFVRQRCLVEILRAWVPLAIVFPLEKAKAIDVAFQAVLAEVQAMLRHASFKLAEPSHDVSAASLETSVTQIHGCIERYWRQLEDQCRSLGFRPGIGAADIGLYLRERPCDQLRFFMRAQRRLQEGQHGREIVMLLLYAFSVLLALVKILAVFRSELPAPVSLAGEMASAVPIDWISAALLAVLVLSAATTNALVSRNERSLLHSYYAQERRIRRWFDAVFAQSLKSGTLLDARLVLEFEEIMFNELLDFVHITSRDIIEVPGI